LQPSVVLVFFPCPVPLCLFFRAVKIAHIRGYVTSMLCALFKFTLVLNSVLFWRLLIFEFLLIYQNYLCSISAVVKTVLLDALQLQMLSVGTLTYLEPKMFLLIMFYNLYFLVINY
jgi:hypothetical protein